VGTAKDGAKELYWSGTSIFLNFEGTMVSAIMKDETGDNYYDIMVDGETIKLLRPDTTLKTYVLVEGLTDEPHQVEIFKRTEYNRGLSWFFGFELPVGANILPKSQPKKHRIEYYGDSITAGYSVTDYKGDSPDSIYTNYALSYGNLIAEYFDAEQHCICKSGIGITVSWFDYEMPDIWNLTNPSDENSTWDFTAYTPDLVIVNLFQNDSWLVNRPDMESFKDNFGDIPPTEVQIVNAYAEFISGIRSKYPGTPIVCTLGNMDITREGSEWPGYVRKAVSLLNDDNIFTVFTPFKESGGHPKEAEQQLIADNLIGFIEQTLGW
tara:strand:- start:139163 stop:140131 length:969 start_codon:yes stop_codon:yes gene_type:complete